MADWSQLPRDLILQITKRLQTRWDIIRFRSICSSWRSSAPPKPPILSVSVPSGDYMLVDAFDLIERSVFLIRLPENRNQWLVKTKEDANGRLQLLDPLSNSEFQELPGEFNDKVLDLSNFQVIELGHEYVLQYRICCPLDVEILDEQYTKKVALLWLSNENDEFVLLASHNYGNLAIYSSRDEQWTALTNTHQWSIDIISFKGKFYAVDPEGTTLVIEPSSRFSLLPHVGSHNEKKFLVESGDELLLIDMFSQIHEDLNMDSLPESCMQVGPGGSSQKIVLFKVYKLEEGGQKWSEVQSLENRVLFLGENCRVSASASQFSWNERNCIIFRQNLLNAASYGEAGVLLDGKDMYVFYLNDGTVKPLKNLNFLWSPPSPISSDNKS